MLVTEAPKRATLGRSEADSFEELFSTHAIAIYNYCFRRTGDWALAEDLCSVVFLEAWRRRRDLDDSETVLPWLYGVATNVLRNQRRALRRHRAALARLPEAGRHPERDSAARLDHQFEMQRLLEAVAQLPPVEQEALTLCRWQGMSYEEAAAVAGVPVGTIRSRVARARRRLASSGERQG
jgi:RNA polymerase sigma-70 factor (ECF subfamily)